MKPKTTIALAAIVLAVTIIGAIWFVARSSSPAPITKPPFTASATTTYSLADIANHSSESDCWTAINGGVYDITTFIPSHPGGPAIIQACGKDGSAMFNSQRAHTRTDAQATLDTYRIGTLQ